MIADGCRLEGRIQEMTKTGLWPNRLLIDYLDEAARFRPDRIAVTSLNTMTGRSTTLSYRQLQCLANRIALGLVALGVQRNDIVSCQLPTWWEMVALYLGCVRIGAIINPLVPILRYREISHMLAFAESTVVVVPHVFRGFDYPGMIAEMRPRLPKLRHCLVVGGEGNESFEANLLSRRWEDEMNAAEIFRERRPDPNDVTQLLFTSGTTGEPKGALHTSNTLIGGLISLTRHVGLSARDVVLGATPLGHQMGFLYGLMMPILLGAKAVLQDAWSAEVAAQLIQDEHVTYTVGSPAFLTDLTDSPAADRYDIRSLSVFSTGGAPIPSVLVERARRRLCVTVLAGWGMTENGTVTITKPFDAPEKTCNTAGIPLTGYEVQVVDEQGRVLPPGIEGRLEERGVGDFVGYLKRPELEKRNPEGWFDTGDLARMDGEGYIRITGRLKDIIIRGGENIPVAEIENLLYTHSAVQDAAVVGMPDSRLGERPCAFVTLRPGQTLSFAEMVHFLDAQRMARQFFPERLEILEEMPRTAVGKIQKFHLRDIASRLTASR
jgi:cyclohexanecarboxylate-CoA ligase